MKLAWSQRYQSSVLALVGDMVYVLFELVLLGIRLRVRDAEIFGVMVLLAYERPRPEI